MGDIFWRDSQRTTRFFIFDAKSSFFLIFFLFHARLWTFIMAIIVMTVFWFLEKKGLSLTTALRAFRTFLVGPNRPRAAKKIKVEYKRFG